jgi:hypothetical protein
VFKETLGKMDRRTKKHNGKDVTTLKSLTPLGRSLGRSLGGGLLTAPLRQGGGRGRGQGGVQEEVTSHEVTSRPSTAPAGLSSLSSVNNSVNTSVNSVNRSTGSNGSNGQRFAPIIRKLRAAAYTQHGQDGKGLFALFDVNHDHLLTPEELGRGIRKLCHVTDAELEGIVVHADTDKDGVISVDEFVRILMPPTYVRKNLRGPHYEQGGEYMEGGEAAKKDDGGKEEEEGVLVSYTHYSGEDRWRPRVPLMVPQRQERGEGDEGEFLRVSTVPFTNDDDVTVQPNGRRRGKPAGRRLIGRNRRGARVDGPGASGGVGRRAMGGGGTM